MSSLVGCACGREFYCNCSTSVNLCSGLNVLISCKYIHIRAVGALGLHIKPCVCSQIVDICDGAANEIRHLDSRLLLFRAHVEDDLRIAGNLTARCRQLVGNGRTGADNAVGNGLFGEQRARLGFVHADYIRNCEVNAANIFGIIIRLYAEIRKNIKKNITDGRRGHQTAGNIHAVDGVFFAVFRIGRGIERDKDDVFRVVDRRNADEGDDLVLDLIAVLVVFVQLFGRAGLAADAVAGRPGRGGRALGDDLLHERAHRLGGLLADDLPQDGLFVFLYGIAVRVHDLAHDIGLEHIAAVDDRGHGAHELHGRDAEALAEGGGDEVGCAVVCRVIEVFTLVEQAAGLAGQVDAGLFHDAEALEIIVERVAAHAQADVAEGDVAGVAEGLGGRLRAVTGGFPAVQDLLTAGELFLAAAVERVVQRDGSGIDCGGQRG